MAYFRLLLESLQPEKILEIGTAIGFSALLMAEHAPQAQITTIDRNPEMIELAKANFAKYDSRQQITLPKDDQKILCLSDAARGCRSASLGKPLPLAP